MSPALRRSAVAATATTCAGVLLAAAAPLALAGSERMLLACDDGRLIERSNGSSWWGVDHGAGYVTEHLLITGDGEVLHEKAYGSRGAGVDRSTCTAAHSGTTWRVELARTR